MLTEKSSYLLIKIFIKKFKLIIPIPIRIAEEILYQFRDAWDILSHFIIKGKVKSVGESIDIVIYFFEGLREYGKFDLVDVDLEDKKEKVKIKIALR